MGNSAVVKEPTAEEELISAAKAGELERITRLVQIKHTDVNCRDENSSTPFMWACAMGHVTAVRSLMGLGCHVEDRDKDGYTGLHWAVVQKHGTVVKELLVPAAKVNVNARNNDGETALHKASYYGQEEIASTLINAGADMNLEDKMHRTPLDRARLFEMRQLLTSLGAKSGDKSLPQDGEGVVVQRVGEAKQDDDADRGSTPMGNEELLRKQRMRGEVKQWLESMALSEYTDTFLSNGFDRMDVVVEVTAEDLKLLGIKLGHIRVIGKSIAEMKQAKDLQEQMEAENAPGAAGSESDVMASAAAEEVAQEVVEEAQPGGS